MSSTRTPLLSDFEKQSTAQWESQVVKELKGKSISEISTFSEDGIETKPFYHHPDYKETGKQLWKNETGNKWLVVEKIVVSNAVEDNKQALHALMNGANALWFVGDITTNNLAQLLQGIELPYIQVFIEPNKDIALVDKAYQEFVANHFNNQTCAGGVYSNTLSHIATTGKWGNKKQELENITTSKGLAISGVQWRNAGGTIVQELAIFLAETNEYLGMLSDDQQITFAKNVVYQTGVGENYFLEMAKIRAIRLLWNNLIKEYKLTNSPLHIHAESLLFNKSIYDQHNNLLRTSTEAMSAIIGGCNSLNVLSFDAAYDGNSKLGNRMARNIQSILKEESYLDKISDPANGSYYVENLTSEIANKAWELFQSIEKSGGYIHALESNQLQEMTATSCKEQELAFEEGKKIVLGVNRYPNANEKFAATKIAVNEPVKNSSEFMAIQSTRVSAKQEAYRQQQNSN